METQETIRNTKPLFLPSPAPHTFPAGPGASTQHPSWIQPNCLLPGLQPLTFLRHRPIPSPEDLQGPCHAPPPRASWSLLGNLVAEIPKSSAREKSSRSFKSQPQRHLHEAMLTPNSSPFPVLLSLIVVFTPNWSGFFRVYRCHLHFSSLFHTMSREGPVHSRPPGLHLSTKGLEVSSLPWDLLPRENDRLHAQVTQSWLCGRKFR